MSTRRVKSLAYEDDEFDYDDDEQYDGYEGAQEETTLEDKERLRVGTIEVRKVLGSAYQVSDNEIQDALWDFYYDITKTVNLLKGKHKPKPNNKSAQTYTNINLPRAFFEDCPWGEVPEHRKASIIIEPLHRFRGLLGGASKDGKMSKLAALAAKRRQRETSATVSTSGLGENDSQEDYAASLSKLSIGREKLKDRKQQSPIDAGTVIEATNPDEHREDVIQTREALDDAPLAERSAPSAFAKAFLDDNDYEKAFDVDTHLFEKKTTYDFKDPSPDDVAFRAQTGRTPNNRPANVSKQQPKAQSKANIANGINNLTISEAPKVKSKNIDVLSEYQKVTHKNAANFVVIGHVDAGKSTLMGRLLFDLKAVDQRTMDRYQKEAEDIGKGSFAFAWVMDQGTEERERGVTIDIATNQFSTEKTAFTILDAPGHQDFVPNMIAGTSQADFAVLVIDASPGNFESGLRGQTREHALLAKSIGVQRMIVAINKMDTVAWSQERFDIIKSQMTTFLKATRFNLASTAFIPCSGLQGSNILEAVTDPAASWYKGETLVQALDAYEPVTHNLDRPLRMTIGDVFRGGIQNPLSVSGRIEAGSLQVGESIIIQPSGETATIRALDLENDLEIDSDSVREWAIAGQNVILHLADIDPIHLRSGDVLCSTNSPIQNITSFTAQILSFAHIIPMNVDIHKGRLHVPGRISGLVGILDKKTGEVIRKKPKIVKPEEAVRVLIELDKGMPIEAGGRIVLRAQGETVGAGLVE